MEADIWLTLVNTSCLLDRLVEQTDRQTEQLGISNGDDAILVE